MTSASFPSLSWGEREGAESIVLGCIVTRMDEKGATVIERHKTTVYYKDYPFYEGLPLAVKCETTKAEWQAYWTKVKREAQAHPAEAIGL